VLRPKRKQINVPGYKGPDRRSGKERRGGYSLSEGMAKNLRPDGQPRLFLGNRSEADVQINRRSGKDRRKKP